MCVSFRESDFMSVVGHLVPSIYALQKPNFHIFDASEQCGIKLLPWFGDKRQRHLIPYQIAGPYWF